MTVELFNPQDHEIAVTGDPTLDVPNAKLRAGEIAAAQAESSASIRIERFRSAVTHWMNEQVKDTGSIPVLTPDDPF